MWEGPLNNAPNVTLKGHPACSFALFPRFEQFFLRGTVFLLLSLAFNNFCNHKDHFIPLNVPLTSITPFCCRDSRLIRATRSETMPDSPVNIKHLA